MNISSNKTGSYFHYVSFKQEQLNSLKVVGTQLTNRCISIVNSYEHLQILWARAPSAPLVPPPMALNDYRGRVIIKQILSTDMVDFCNPGLVTFIRSFVS